MEIFVVDDERIIAGTLAIILRNRGYSATTSTDPIKAISQIVEARPALVICDHSMPALTGIELLQQVIGQLPTCKAILFSADLVLDEHPDYRLLTEIGRCRVISKPIYPEALLAAIETLIGKPGAVAKPTQFVIPPLRSTYMASLAE